MRIRASTITLSLATGTVALLAGVGPETGPSPAPQAVPARTITLDPVHSVALFRIQHLEAGLFWGRFNALEGKATWNLEARGAPSFEVIAKVANADTGSEKLDGNLQGPNFFNAKEFPTITFTSTGARALGDRHWTVTGNLTLRGVTKPVEVDCTATGIGDGPTGKRAGFECTLDIRRSDFGMKWGIEKPPKALGDEVRLVIALEGEVGAAP